MNKKLKAAVSRAYDRAAEVDRRYDEDGIKTLLCVLADEPAVLAYVRNKAEAYDVHIADMRDILRALAEIVK